ncbi:uncharacterized protein LOC114362951 [Ostrinia furnacalis]|uniref:uncharacterized protein LOC114362951 n=1 Tax=Ostrinia furnacalis TaxID=93504 RepID=UPI001039A098|nr:uncharacterized protein LOC114362951 [Ostrinia furnacalis]
MQSTTNQGFYINVIYGSKPSGLYWYEVNYLLFVAGGARVGQKFPDGVGFITIVGNRRLLMAHGYTFSQTALNYWYCSKKQKGCKARVSLTADEKEVASCCFEHDHPPPVYKRLQSGLYKKMSS